MTLPAFRSLVPEKAAQLLLVLVLIWAGAASADQVAMSNGDRYVGQVQSLSGDTLVLRSEVLGTLRLPRSKISTILLEPLTTAVSGTNVSQFSAVASRSRLALSSNNVTRVSGPSSTNASADFSATIQQLGANSNALRQVQEQLLTGAGPEAQAKFNDLLGGLLSGKVDLAGLRAEAKTTLDQAKRVRSELGDEGGGMLDSYLSILDGFLKETESEAAATNQTPGLPAKPKLQKPLEQE